MDRRDSCGGADCRMRRLLGGLTSRECCEYRYLNENAMDVPDRLFDRYIELGDRVEAALRARLPARVGP